MGERDYRPEIKRNKQQRDTQWMTRLLPMKGTITQRMKEENQSLILKVKQ